jgi:hypothetical protein
MHTFRFGCGALLCVLLAGAVAPQQSSTGAALLLQRSRSLLAGSSIINDVTLTGTAHRIAGSDDETGTAVLKALATGESRMDMAFASGQRSEIWKNSGYLNEPQAGVWTGPDGQTHPMALHNLIIDSSWFFPAMTLSRWLSIPGYAITLIGQETRNGESVQHVSVWLTATALNADVADTFRHLSQTEIYLDSSSGLPAALTFNIHPDNNMLVDLPIEIRLSDYRVVNGAQVPFHIEKYLNGALILDLHVDAVTLNSGLSGSDFQIQ